MVAIKNFLLFAIGVSAIAVPNKRQAAAVQSALQKVNSDTGALTTAANNYNGGFANALPVQNAASTLNNDIKAATDTASNSAVVSESEAQGIIDYVTGTLKGSTASAIDAVIAKKSRFASDGLSGLVKNTLSTTLSNVKALSSALIAKTPDSLKSSATSASDSIVAEVQRGVDAFA